MTTAQQNAQAETRVLGILGVTTPANALAQLDGLLSFFVELAGAFPEAAKQIAVERWKQVAGYGGDALRSVVEGDLVKYLHANECHPDWVYESKEHPRKCGYSNQPDGFGWVDNNEKDHGVTRYDNTEDHHFRRLKSDAAKDNLSMRELPVPEITKMKNVKWIEMLQASIRPHLMPSSTAKTASSSSMYVSTRSTTSLDEILSVEYHNGIYMLTIADPEATAGYEEILKGIGLPVNFFHDAEGTPQNVFIYEEAVRGASFRVITNLVTLETYATRTRKDKSWQKWTKWDYFDLPVDTNHLIEVLASVN